jgi:C1A family cysteine protease
LAGRFPPVRDQGQRGTCVAFASVAFLQYHLAAGSPKGQRLSEQFVYWACKELDGIPQEEGTHVRTAREVIEKCGACRATTWKYVPKPVAGNEGQGPPPPGAEAEAKDCRWAKARAASAGKVEHLQQLLKEGKPVVLSVLTFPLWDFPVVEQTGEITLPLPETQPDGAHAVCLVGYELNDRLPGGGAFLFRNSWGRKWAQRGGRFGPGHGTLLFEYVNLYAMEAFA